MPEGAARANLIIFDSREFQLAATRPKRISREPSFSRARNLSPFLLCVCVLQDATLTEAVLAEHEGRGL